MISNKQAFTLVEIVITLVITSVLFIIIGTIYPSLITIFTKQKENLDFQQSFVLDSFYLNQTIQNSSDFLPSLSSGMLNKENSYLTLLKKPGNPHYSFIYLGDDSGNIHAKESLKLHIKNTFFYSDFVKVQNDIYFTHPGQHTIEKYTYGESEAQVVYGVKGISGYNNTGKGLFHTPTGITTDGTYLYIADSGNNMIRKIHLSTNQITPVVGKFNKRGFNEEETSITGTLIDNVVFDFPTGIAWQSGELYVSDTFNNRIRKITDTFVYSIIGGNAGGFNFDNALAKDTFIHYPLSLEEVPGGIVFGDVGNGKIRYFKYDTQEVVTLIGIETQKQLIGNISKYNKNFFNTQIQSYASGFYLNDMSKGIIYNYTFGQDGVLANTDDTLSYFLGSDEKNLLHNGSFEEDSLDEIGKEDDENFISSFGEYFYPIFGKKYLKINTEGKTASGVISISNNPLDGDILGIENKVFEFDNDNIFISQNIVVPIGTFKEETFQNLLDEFENYNIPYEKGDNSIKVMSHYIGNIGNSTIFSGSLLLSPNTGNMSGGEDYTTGYTSFSVSKDLEAGKKYRLSFYIAAKEDIKTDIFHPAVQIRGPGFEEKLLHINNKWAKKEFIISGGTNILQNTLEFDFQYGNIFYIDNIQLISLENLQDFSQLSNKGNIKTGFLNSFYIDDEKIFISDIRKSKMYLIDQNILFPIKEDFSFFDIDTLKINLKNDYLGVSLIDTLHFYISDISNIIYHIGKNDYIIKLSHNIKNNAYDQ